MNDLYYIIKIYFNQYAGDIDRKLCAFLTGVVGEEDDTRATRFIDREVAKEFQNTMRIERGDKGWRTPCRSDGNEVHLLFRVHPSVEQIKIIKDRLPLFEEDYKEKDVFAEYIGDLNLQVERIELTKVETKETPLSILDEPKSAL